MDPQIADSAPFSPQFDPQPNSSLSSTRKRSRDDAEENLAEGESFSTPFMPLIQEESQEGWVYGPGMTLMKPNGVIIEASSQTGTWVEEQSGLSQPLSSNSQKPSSLSHDRPALRNHKSQRLDKTAMPATSEALNNNEEFAGVSSCPHDIFSRDPIVDFFTLHLGIGWSSIGDDEDMQAAARGWAKYIENHYTISSPSVKAQSKGLASYLVESKEGWFLFQDDLKQGQFIAKSADKAFENLHSSPPIFDGAGLIKSTEFSQSEEMLEASTLGASRAHTVITGCPHLVDTFSQPQATTSSSLNASSKQLFEIEMDTS